jgi:lipid II:glycine glycyltransferase (peptidoglycan interpeptide bridge formation enzyme)
MPESPTTTASFATPAALAWNERLTSMNGHLLQSWAWGEFKSQHGWQPERILIEDSAGTAMAQVLYRSRWGASVGYVPRGPVIEGNPEILWNLLIDELDHQARQRRAILTLIEPNAPLGLTGDFRSHDVVAGPDHLQPGRTVKIPLGNDEAILKQMHQKTRYNVRLAQRRGVTIERHCAEPEALDTFYELMQDTAQRNEFGIHSRAYYADFMHQFGDDAVLLFSRLESGALAAVLIAAKFGAEGIYMYGASSTQHRADGAAFQMQFDAMRWARDQGCTTYDLWGIPDEDPDSVQTDGPGAIAGTKGDDWRGLYRFKTGFGGDIVSYPPVVERRHVPVLPWLARKLNVIKS